MFKFKDFRSEKLATWEKHEIADALIVELKKDFHLKESTLIDNLFTLGEINSYQALVDMAKIFKAENQRLGLVIVPYDNGGLYTSEDIRGQLELLGMSNATSNVPYIAWSFPEEYREENPHGERWQDVFMFFVTKYKAFEEAEECVAYYVDKYNQIGVFT